MEEGTKKTISALELFGVDEEFGQACIDVCDDVSCIPEMKAELMKIADTPEKRDWAMFYLGRRVEQNERCARKMAILDAIL